MLVVYPLVGKREGTGEESIDLGKALADTCNECALSALTLG